MPVIDVQELPQRVTEVLRRLRDEEAVADGWEDYTRAAELVRHVWPADLDTQRVLDEIRSSLR